MTLSMFGIRLHGRAAVVVALGVTPVGSDWFDSLGDRINDLRESGAIK